MPSATTPYHGLIVEVSVETAELPDGRRARFEVVRHPGGAAVVAVGGDERVCLLRQYRHVVGDWLWELPAGKLDGGEPPLAAARRELAEEAGLHAREWESLGTMVSSPGVFTERIHLFLARGLEAVEARAEDHELFEVRWMPLRRALEWAVSGEIVDAKTIVGLLRARARLHGAAP